MPGIFIAVALLLTFWLCQAHAAGQGESAGETLLAQAGPPPGGASRSRVMKQPRNAQRSRQAATPRSAYQGKASAKVKRPKPAPHLPQPVHGSYTGVYWPAGQHVPQGTIRGKDGRLLDLSPATPFSKQAPGAAPGPGKTTQPGGRWQEPPKGPVGEHQSDVAYPRDGGGYRSTSGEVLSPSERQKGGSSSKTGTTGSTGASSGTSTFNPQGTAEHTLGVPYPVPDDRINATGEATGK